MPRRSAPRNDAFTLIELSIVILIIGLIVGGVLVGQDLIEGAKRQKILSEKNQIELAVNTFRLKYNGLPGDLSNGFQFFGGQLGCTANNSPDTFVDDACNGNGNKRIDTGFPSGNWRDYRIVWTHLYYAGLMPNLTVDTATSSGDCNSVRICPYKSSYSSDTFYRLFYGTKTLFSYGDIPYAHYLRFQTTTSGNYNLNTNGSNGAIRSEAAYALDAKADDGAPNTGSIITYKYNTSGVLCTSSGSNTYLLTETAANCEVHFKLGF